MSERYDLTMERIRLVVLEKSVAPLYQDFFQTTAKFIMDIDAILRRVSTKSYETCSLEELQRENADIYQDVQGENYEASYANPTYAVQKFGREMGQFLCALYTEIRGEIAYAYEKNIDYITICNELFIEVYNCFEGVEEPDYKEIREILYWYANDYYDVFLADQIEEQVNPARDFATKIIMESDLTDLRYLYQYGEYISDTEWKTAAYLNSLPQETIDRMAEVYTEGYRVGFVHAGIDLSKKTTVDLRYVLGFERMMKKAIQNFEAMGLRPTACRSAVSMLTKKQNHKLGYYGGIANKQYEYDHRFDLGLILDKKLVERRLDVIKNAYEGCREHAYGYAGPAVVEVFGEEPFAPLHKEEAISLTEEQEKLSVLSDSKAKQITNQYIKGEERSFTIIAFPVPDIGEKYPEIFEEVIRINTLDADLYESVQQTLIDALDQGEYVHILGKGENVTDLKVSLYPLTDPDKETIFENCVADVNIPVGEVFTSPVLEGTSGVLHVSKVFLNELQYQNLQITFEDGMISDYTCSNFDSEADCKKFMKSNLLFNHDTLPLGEFAIGTNTTAYVVAKKYGIEDKMPILIAEKMGPNFAVGDTCYSWSEENRLYNPNGKEIVAKDNSVSILRKEDLSKAYFQCHTDITIPYEEIAEITVVTSEGKKIPLLEDGRFVLAGTEILNEPLHAL